MTIEEFIAGLVGLAIMIGMRLLDYALPKNHHFKFMERFITENDDDDETESAKE